MSASLETMEQLEEMRVSDLKEFIQRHGYSPSKIPRIDGTAGPPKKSDLLHAAKQILLQIKSSSSPIRAVSTNPFQRRASTSDTSLRLSLSSPHPSDPAHLVTSAPALHSQPPRLDPAPARPPTAPVPTRPSTATASETVLESSSSMPPRTLGTAPAERRKSHSAINPNFAHLFTSSSSAAKPAVEASVSASAPVRSQDAQSASRRTTVDPRFMRDVRLLSSQLDPAPRRTTVGQNVVSPTTSVAVADMGASATAVAAARLQIPERPPRQSVPSTMPQVVPSAPAPETMKVPQARSQQPHTVPSLPPKPPTPRTPVALVPEHSRPSNLITPSSMQIAERQPVSTAVPALQEHPVAARDDDPPSLPKPSESKRPKEKAPAEKREEVDRYLNDDSSGDVDMRDVYDPVTSTDEGDQSDIINESASDYGSSLGGDSDAGSTVETDDDTLADNFADWNASQLRSWLSSQGINFPQTNQASELLPIARAHKMFLDTNADTDIIVPVPSSLPNESQKVESRIGTHSEGPKQRRGRRQGRITAPDEDDDAITEVRPRPPKRRTNKNPQRSQGSTPKQITLRMRLHAAVLSAMAGIFLSSLVAALIWLYQNGTRPYCDSVFVFTKGVEDVALSQGPIVDTVMKEVGSENSTANMTQSDLRCIPCPKYGICRNGGLTCMSGYIDVNGRCVEDEEFSVYAEALATEASAVLSDVAGQAICGLRSSRYVRWNEVVESVREGEINRPKRRFFQARRPAYEEHKFDAAMVAARRRLLEDDVYNVEILSNRELTSREPTITLPCRVKLFIWEHLGRVVLAIMSIGALIYLRVKIGMRRTYTKRINGYYEKAVEVLQLHKEDYENKFESYAFVKDVILRADVVGQATKENIEIWKDVEKKLNEDPRILRASRTVDGVPSYTFEWAGRRRSSSVGDGLSRRSSFGSRGSLDSLELDDDFANSNTSTGRRSVGSFLGGWSDRES